MSEEVFYVFCSVLVVCGGRTSLVLVTASFLEMAIPLSVLGGSRGRREVVERRMMPLLLSRFQWLLVNSLQLIWWCMLDLFFH